MAFQEYKIAELKQTKKDQEKLTEEIAKVKALKELKRLQKKQDKADNKEAKKQLKGLEAKSPNTESKSQSSKGTFKKDCLDKEFANNEDKLALYDKFTNLKLNDCG